MEVGSGSGFVCCSVALMLQHALIRSHGLAVDISEHAVEATCGTLLAHDVRQAAAAARVLAASSECKCAPSGTCYEAGCHAC